MSEPKEWTLMFYFAGDNNLAPLLVSLLKEIKDAGFQQETDVLVYFDPSETGVPTRLYHVNHKRREHSEKKTRVGDANDPFVRNMDEDRIDPATVDTALGPMSAAMKQGLESPDSITANKSLENFIGFCRESHAAKRYMLYLIGHGLVVGNDAFLPDENPPSGITLKCLGEILGDFARQVKDEGSEFELVTLHSCSMSAIEVAYELKGTANYMIAAEGPSFVGSWPYRQLLKKTFNHLIEAKEKAPKAARGARPGSPRIDVQELVEKLYFLTLFNSTDFMRAGYSHDLALCSLNPEKFDGLTGAIRNLADLLIKGLKASRPDDGSAPTQPVRRIQELVLLAHWEAQSYWQESYTDLVDYCKCLLKRCDPKDKKDKLAQACSDVISRLATTKSGSRRERFKGIVIHSENFGSKFQYSHGLSIYFPWSRPLEIAHASTSAGSAGSGHCQDAKPGILANYQDYAFTKEMKNAGGPSWLDFLETYFTTTQRASRREEDGVTLDQKALERAKGSFNHFGTLAGSPAGILAAPPDKPTGETDKPTAETGTVCTCPSIKNYPEEESTLVRGKRVKTVKNVPKFQITEGALQAFKPLKPRKDWRE